jgi:hypothetical protein
MNQKQAMFHTMNIMVATILMSYGFKLITYTHITRADGKESKEFWFEANSDTCEFTAEQASIYLTKGSDELSAKDPEHPLLWMRAVLMNRNQLVEIIKKAPRMVEITNGPRRALIAANASDETKRKIAAML